MMKYLTILIALMATPTFSQQVSEINKIGEKEVSPGNILYQLPEPPPKTVGTQYLDEQWWTGSVTFNSDLKISDYPLRFDLKNNLLEVKVKDGVKVIRSSLIKAFTLYYTSSDSSVFINTKALYKNEVVSDIKIMQLLFSSKRDLYRHTDTYIQHSNYNQALNVGEKDNRIKKNESYYLTKEDELIKLDKKVKRNEEVFGNQYEEVVEFAKNNNLRLNRENDIIRVLNFLEAK